MRHPTKGRVAMISLGCPRNLVDSQAILKRFRLKGYKIVEEISQADIGLVNTCAFINDAKKESVDTLLDLIELKKAGKLKKIVVYGCLSQRYKYELADELPEIDAFVGRISLDPSRDEIILTPSHYAYLKICEGCVNNCSYCAIPKIKGPLDSLDIDSLVGKAKDLDKKGIAELNIIGQDITSYGLDIYGKSSLERLLNRILKETDIDWVRLLYLYPSRISEDLLKIIRDHGRVCKYIDLPLQHINDRILALMNRRGASKKYIYRLIAKIRKLIPEVALRTAFIVGFPSETDREFKELLDFIEEMRFERLGVFIYSPEEHTSAFKMAGQVPHRIKVERFDIIMRKQQEISSLINKKYLGRPLDVLIDKKEADYYLGRTQHDAPEVDGLVYVHSDKLLKAGDLVSVGINDTLEYDLVGKFIRKIN